MADSLLTEGKKFLDRLRAKPTNMLELPAVGEDRDAELKRMFEEGKLPDFGLGGIKKLGIEDLLRNSLTRRAMEEEVIDKFGSGSKEQSKAFRATADADAELFGAVRGLPNSELKTFMNKTLESSKENVGTYEGTVFEALSHAADEEIVKRGASSKLGGQ